MPHWLEHNDLPEDEQRGLMLAHELLVETGIARWSTERERRWGV